MDNLESKYLDFAAKVSFFEFIEDEFRPSKIPIDSLSAEINRLGSRGEWNIDDLSDFIKNNPRSFLIFQEIFQLQRFTNTQMIHFMFDTSRMNTLRLDSTFEYAVLNLLNDPQFQKTFLELIQKRIRRTVGINEILRDRAVYPKATVVAIFKMTIPYYIKKMQDDVSLIASRLSNREFGDCPVRMANYFLDKLELNKTLRSINLTEYLKNKKIPRDTKGIHGNYLKMRIKKMLDEHGYFNLDEDLKKLRISELPPNLANKLPRNLYVDRKVYCTEKSVEGIVKQADGRRKKFDLIIFVNGKPKHLFEMNFYSTEGTKIGINEGEYLELSKFIEENTDFRFHWITDGNYWLTENGEKRLRNLWNRFGEIYNINTFEERLWSFSS
jgi:hypothetical protein